MQRALRAQCEELCCEREKSFPGQPLGCRHAKSATGLADVGKTRRDLKQEAYPSTRAGKIRRALYTNDREPRKAANPGVKADAEVTRSSRTDKKCGDVCKRRRRRSVLAAWGKLPARVAEQQRCGKWQRNVAEVADEVVEMEESGERRAKSRAASVPGDVVHATVRLAAAVLL